MGTTIRELLVKLGVDADTKSVAQFDAGIDKVKTGLTDLAKVGLVTAGAVAAVTAALIALTVETARAGDEIAKTADALGISAEELQKWRAAADKAGVSTEELDIALKTLTRTSANAATGTGEAVQAFKDFGIEVKNADGSVKSQTQLLKELADNYNNIEDPVKRAAALQKIFGESGAALGPLLAEGADGIEELMERAEDLGLIMSEEQVRASEKFVDAMTDVQAVLTGIRNRISMALMPAMTDIINTFVEWFIANKDLIDQKIDSFMETLGTILEEIPKKAAGIIDFFGGIENVLIALVTVGGLLTGGVLSVAVLTPIVSILSGLVTILGAVATALGIGLAPVVGLVLILFANLIAIIGVLAGFWAILLLAIQDVYTFLQGGDSVWGRLLERLGLSEKAFKTMWDMINTGKSIIMELWGLFSALSELFVAVVTPAIGLVLTALKPLFDNFVEFISWIGSGALDVIDFFVQRLAEAADVMGKIAGAISGLSSAISGDVGVSAGSAAGSSAVSNSSNSNSVNQNNTINVNGASNPQAVGNEVVDQVGAMLNGAAAAFQGGDI